MSKSLPSHGFSSFSLCSKKASLTVWKAGVCWWWWTTLSSFWWTQVLHKPFCHKLEAAGHWCALALGTERSELSEYGLLLCVFMFPILSVCSPSSSILSFHPFSFTSQGVPILSWLQWGPWDWGAYRVAQWYKNPPAKWETWIWSLVRKIPWRSKWQPTPVFLPGKSHGQRSMAGYSPWGCKTVRHGLAIKQQKPWD